MRYLLILLMALGLGACGGKKASPATTDTSATTAAPHSDLVYTCSMHPQVKLDHPGQCPICGMQLIAEKKGIVDADGTVVLSDQQVQLGGIRLDTVGASVLGDRMLLAATVSTDETRSSTVSGRITGRIEKLYFKETGAYIRKGDKLYDLYSEELNNAKQEYLLAQDRVETLKGGLVDLRQLAEAARNKLLLWGMSEAQVAELARTRQAATTTSFYSPASGYVSAIESHEGDYLSAGTVVVRLADISSVWVEAQVYTSQLPDLDRRGSVTIRCPDLPGKEFTGKISLVNPELDPDQRINLVRITLENPAGLLKPGMAAAVTITGGARNSLTLPESAVLRLPTGNMVWVQAGHNSFRPVMVQTGQEGGGRIEIRAGLQQGDVIVSEGAYLVNSEYSFKHGSDAMAGMKM
ncbi:MAG: efflux RND transporter periplasmic adaptor subunit [Bacteroidetes bacterium]|nr:efflux RND transporter periplasmic adaptor subunit [Bacteroidota bacterium]